ncbi:hypothetical protein SAMN02745221_01523, partial [Thermosyntropha lipolytica DSM 11003]
NMSTASSAGINACGDWLCGGTGNRSTSTRSMKQEAWSRYFSMKGGTVSDDACREEIKKAFALALKRVPAGRTA